MKLDNTALESASQTARPHRLVSQEIHLLEKSQIKKMS